MNQQEQLIQQHIAALPVQVQQAIEEFDWAQVVLDIARKHRIGIDEADLFHDQTLMVIVGMVPAKDYAKNLETSLGINQELAEKLVSEANTQIFSVLQQKAFRSNEATENAQPTINKAPVPKYQSMEKEKMAQRVVKKGDTLNLSM